MDTVSPPAQSFHFESNSERSILTLNPQLNEVQWGDVERVGAEILRQMDALASPALLVDLSPLDYMGSAQLALLVRIWKWLKTRKGRMVVQLSSPMVREVLTIAGLHTLWEIVDSREEAFRLLGLQPDGRAPVSVAGPLTGIIALLAAMASLCVHLVIGRPGSPQTVLAMAFAFSAAALVAGAVTIVRETGSRRGLGVGIALAGLLLTIMEMLTLPK